MIINKIKKIKKAKGFSLIELLVVLLLFAILLSVAIPALLGNSEKAEQASIRFEMRSILNTAMRVSLEKEYEGYPEASELRSDVLATEPQFDLRLPPGSQSGAVYIISPASSPGDLLELEGYSRSGEVFCLRKNWNDQEELLPGSC